MGFINQGQITLRLAEKKRHEGEEEGNGNEEIGMEGPGRGGGLNIDKMVIMPGSEGWEGKSAPRKTGWRSSLYLKWHNDRRGGSGGGWGGGQPPPPP